jgi:hypothetical protein
MCGEPVRRIRGEQRECFLKEGGVIAPPFCFDVFEAP